MESTMFDKLIHSAIDAGLAIAVAVLVPLVTQLLLAAVRKARVGLSAEYEAQIRDAIRHTALRLEEEAATALKHGQPAKASAAKLQQLAGETQAFILERIPPRLRPVFEPRIIRMIHEELPAAGIGAIASLRAKWLDERNPPPIGPLPPDFFGPPPDFFAREEP